MQHRVLRVSLLTISPHNRAILEFFFAGAGKHLFRMVSLGEAEAVVIDYDHSGAREEWEQLRQTNPLPCIVLSIREVSLPDSIWVPKPLTSRALADAATRVLALLPVPQSKEDVQLSHARDKSSTLLTEPVMADSHSSLSSVSQPFGVPARKIAPEPTPFLETPSVAPSPVSQRMGEGVSTANEIMDAARNKPLLVREIPAPVVELDSRPDPIQQQQRWELLCGVLPDMAPNILQQEGNTYRPDHYLLALVMQASQQASTTGSMVQLVTASQHYILFLPQQHYVFSTLDIHSPEFAMLCTIPVVSSQTHIHVPVHAELSQFEALTQKYASHLYDWDACIWTVSLLTSRGRLEQNTNPNQAYRLKHWPNLTRIESIPHVMSIAAMWTQQAASPLEIAQQLGIPQRYVFAFQGATINLNLLVREQSATKPNLSTEPKKNRGLFSRLLKRLLGGGAR